MGKIGLVLSCLVSMACGRIGFDGDAGANDGQPPSCASLAATCGPAGTSSCCGSPIIPGGMFYRSNDDGADGMFTDTSTPATVNDFRLDMYEATVGRFRQFVEAGMGTQANPPAAGSGARTLNGMPNQGGWDPAWNASLRADTTTLVAAVQCDTTHPVWTDVAGANESSPMTCLTWFEAFAFCTWDGGFLPTEAEWNYAAVGGGEQRAYPWSTPASSLAIDCSYANYDGGAYCISAPNGGVNRVGSESPKGDGKWGQADLAGNVWEWSLDGYESSYDVPCDECADLTDASNRINRGGDFNIGGAADRGADRAYAEPTNRGVGGGYGVRCARAL